MLSLLLLLSLGTTKTYASQNFNDPRMNDPRWYQLQNAEIRETTKKSHSVVSDVCTHKPAKHGLHKAGDVDLSDIINYGKIAWDIIVKGKAVLDFTGLEANALPKGDSDWQDLECWQNPIARSFNITYKNGFGAEVVNFNYKVVYSYGGRVNGTGRYLAHVSVIPDVKVLWGFAMDAKVTAETPLNAGSTVNPLGQIQIDLEYTLKPFVPLWSVQEKQSFVIRGDGYFQKL